VSVKGLSAVASIEVGTGDVCALLRDGAAACWGQNFNGELGSGSVATPGSGVPVRVVGLGP